MYFETLPAVNVSGEKAGQPRIDQIKNTKLNKTFEVPAAKFVFPQFGVDPRVTETVTEKDKDGNEVTREVVKYRDLTEDEARVAIDEAASSAGGVIQLAAFINDAVAKAAVNTGKARIRTATSGTDEDVINAGLKDTRDYVLAAPERTSIDVKEVKSTLKEIQSKGVENLSEDELRALVAKMLG